MSRFSHYGSGQRLAFAMLSVGFGLCLLGAVVPFWLKSEINMSDVSMGFEKDVPVVGDLLHKLMSKYNLVKVNMGVWVLCYEFDGSQTKCYSMYSDSEDTDFNHDDIKDGNAWIQFVRLAIAINIKLSLIAGIAACCRCMCCSGGRTICHGVFTFIAGACGIFAFAVMAAHKEDIVPGIQLFELDYDWAFYIYGAGSCLMILASLFLCFAMPRETPGGVVMMPMPGAGAPYIHVSNTNTNQNVVNAPVNQYELNGQIRSFEPLPEQPTAFNQPPPQYKEAANPSYP